MKCHFCGNKDTLVLESRVIDDGDSVRRRRECEKCHKRFTTYEKVKESILWVLKKNGVKEPFEKSKVRRGILRAIEKRPITLERAEEIVDQIEKEMLRKEKVEVESRMIGRAILRRLKRIDEVAWLRFASVYLEFENLADFKTAISK